MREPDEPRTDHEPGADEARPRRRRRSVREERAGVKSDAERRVPAWVVVPLTTAVGYAVSDVMGAAFGLVAGLVLWWSRR